MKVLSTDKFISERVKVKSVINAEFDILQKKYGKYAYFPQTRLELIHIIDERIKNEGPECDLNNIDTSKITDMHRLFVSSELRLEFNGDISKWDVSHVTDMGGMFMRADFNGDISKWDVSNVANMRYMFFGSKFAGDISGWKVKQDVKHISMFDLCPINYDKSKQPKFTDY